MAVLKVVNTSGKYHDRNSVYDVIDYCCNNSKVKNGIIGGIAVDPIQAAFEMETLARLMNNTAGIKLRHMILSFSPDELTDPFIAFIIARQVAVFYGINYQILFCVHEDCEHIHIHFVMNSVSYNTGLKYPGTKKDYYDFQAHIKATLKEHGVYSLTVP